MIRRAQPFRGSSSRSKSYWPTPAAIGRRRGAAGVGGWTVAVGGRRRWASESRGGWLQRRSERIDWSPVPHCWSEGPEWGTRQGGDTGSRHRSRRTTLPFSLPAGATIELHPPIKHVSFRETTTGAHASGSHNHDSAVFLEWVTRWNSPELQLIIFEEENLSGKVLLLNSLGSKFLIRWAQ